MNHYVIEFYSAKPAWNALSIHEKMIFFNKIGAGMPALDEAGIKSVAFGRTDRSVIRAVDHDFFALWLVPDEAASHLLLAAIDETGWHDYFLTINSAGADTGFNQHMNDLIG